MKLFNKQFKPIILVIVTLVISIILNGLILIRIKSELNDMRTQIKYLESKVLLSSEVNDSNIEFDSQVSKFMSEQTEINNLIIALLKVK